MNPRPEPGALKFGVTIHAAGSAEEFRQSVVRAESLGFDVIAEPDHLGALAPFTALATAAAIASTATLRTYVLNSGFWNPALLAREVATLDLLTGWTGGAGSGRGVRSRRVRAGRLPWPGSATAFDDWRTPSSGFVRSWTTKATIQAPPRTACRSWSAAHPRPPLIWRELTRTSWILGAPASARCQPRNLHPAVLGSDSGVGSVRPRGRATRPAQRRPDPDGLRRRASRAERRTGRAQLEAHDGAGGARQPLRSPGVNAGGGSSRRRRRRRRSGCFGLWWRVPSRRIGPAASTRWSH